MKESDALLEEIGDSLHCSAEAVRQSLEKLEITRKKTLNYIERSETARKEFKNEIETVSVTQRIYVDENGVSQFYCHAHARALCEKCVKPHHND